MLDRVLGLLRDALRGAMASRGAIVSYQFTQDVPASGVQTLPITMQSDVYVWSYSIVRETEDVFMESLSVGAVNHFDTLDGNTFSPPGGLNATQNTAQSAFFMRRGLKVNQATPMMWRVRNNDAGAPRRITITMECYIQTGGRR